MKAIFKIRMSVLTLIGLSSISLAGATADNYSPQYNICMDRSGGTTTAMRECNRAELARQDHHLNENYKHLIHKLGKNKRQELKSVQREWIKYRDKKCGFYYGLTGGTMDSLAGDDCVLEMTIQRAAELRDIGETI
jgi:uncharacterized protein YecT (DUF1311 family)